MDKRVDFKYTLDAYKIPNVFGEEKFSFGNDELEFKILDFWKWNQSDLVENRTRGILAEFIVKQSLEVQLKNRLEWDNYDLVTEDQTKIEIKSAAYIQSWSQKKPSSIRFGISKSKKILMDNKRSDELERQSDIYIFCLLHHKDVKTINPINLKQWTFFIVKTQTLDDELGDQKTLGLSKLLSINHVKCSYNELKHKLDIVKEYMETKDRSE